MSERPVLSEAGELKLAAAVAREEHATREQWARSNDGDSACLGYALALLAAHIAVARVELPAGELEPYLRAAAKEIDERVCQIVKSYANSHVSPNAAAIGAGEFVAQLSAQSMTQRVRGRIAVYFGHHIQAAIGQAWKDEADRLVRGEILPVNSEVPTSVKTEEKLTEQIQSVSDRNERMVIAEASNDRKAIIDECKRLLKAAKLPYSDEELAAELGWERSMIAKWKAYNPIITPAHDDKIRKLLRDKMRALQSRFA